MPLSNDVKIKLAKGFMASIQRMERTFVAKNKKAAFSHALFNLIESLMVELADKVTEEEFVAELEVVMALEEQKALDVAKAHYETIVQNQANEELAIESRLQDAESRRADVRPGKLSGRGQG